MCLHYALPCGKRKLFLCGFRKTPNGTPPGSAEALHMLHDPLALYLFLLSLQVPPDSSPPWTLPLGLSSCSTSSAEGLR
jgi:hypothetical protein